MSRALRNAAYALSGLLFTATALAGARLLGDPANGFRTRLDYEDARATSPFLSEARRLVPPEDGVLVVSALVPLPTSIIGLAFGSPRDAWRSSSASDTSNMW